MFAGERYKAHGDLARQGRQAVPSRHPLLGRRQYEDVRRGAAAAARARFRRGAARRRRSRRPGRSPTSDFAPYYTEAERLYHVHGAARQRPDRAALQRSLSASGDLARAAHPAARRRPDAGRASPVSAARSASCSTKRARSDSACIRCATCDGFPCLVQAKADAHVVCVKPALRYPNVTLLTGAYVERIETIATGREATRGRRAPRWRGRSATAPTSSWSPAARSIRRRCCCARPIGRTRTGSPTAPASSAVTTCATTTRR